MARPTIYSDQVAGEIERRLACGEPLVRICADDDMPSYTTVRRWESDMPEFRAISTRAKQDGTHYLADDALRIADDDQIETQRAKLMIDTRLRLIGKWNAKAYGDKTALVGGSDDDSPIRTETKLDVSALSAEQLRALSSIKVNP